VKVRPSYDKMNRMRAYLLNRVKAVEKNRERLAREHLAAAKSRRDVIGDTDVWFGHG